MTEDRPWAWSHFAAYQASKSTSSGRKPAALAHPSGASRPSSSKQGRKAGGIRRFPSVQASTARDSPDTQAPVEVSRAFCRPGSPDEEVIKEEVTSVQPPTPLQSSREPKHKARGWFRAR